MIPSIEYNYFLWFAKLKNIFPGFFWIEILKIVIFSLFGKFWSRSWIGSWQNIKNDSFVFSCILLCFVHDMDTIGVDLGKCRSLNSTNLYYPFKGPTPSESLYPIIFSGLATEKTNKWNAIIFGILIVET